MSAFPPKESPSLGIALAHAALGRRVFPAILGDGANGRRTKTPLVPWKDQASSDPEAVRRLWRLHRNANLAGWALDGGSVALDVDDPARFADLGLDLPETASQQTPSGGYHYLYESDGRPVRQTVKEIPGADTRVGGKGWLGLYGEDSFTDRPVARAPELLYGAERPERPTTAGGDEQLGTRDEILGWLGGLRRYGTTEAEMLAALLQAHEDGRVVDIDESRPWTDKDLRTLAREAARWAADGPTAHEEAFARSAMDGIERWKDRVLRRADGVPAAKTRHAFGGDWILDGPEVPEPVWGAGAQVLWPKGEALVLVGGVGAGKTTIAGQAILHGIGALSGPFLGYPIKLPEGVVGYVAADRPSQIRRSFRRMVTEAMRGQLNERMDVWSGALPFALDDAKPGKLADFVEGRGWKTLVIDSLKDLVANTTDDQSGLAINRQVQECLVRGIEVLVLHHQRKASEMNKKPKRLDDVYGSRWITAGAGSVLIVWGDAGSARVELSHLKPPAEAIGPLELLHDHPRGKTTVEGMADIPMPDRLTSEDLLAAMAKLGPSTLEDLASACHVSKSTVQRRMAALKKEGMVDESQASSTSPKLWSVVAR